MLLAVVAAGCLTWAVVNALNDAQPALALVPAFLAIPFGLGAAYYALLWQRYSVVFHDDAVDIVTAFRQRRVMKSDVSGWVFKDADDVFARMIVLQIKGDTRGVELPLARVKDDAIVAWFADIPNAEDVLAAESMEALLADARYGATPDIRYTAVVRERRIANVLSLVTILSAAWIALWPNPYPLALAAGLLMPIAAFILAILLQDRWDFAGTKAGDQKPSVALFVLFPPIAVLLRVMDYRIVDMPRLVFFGCAFGAVAWLLLFVLRNATRRLSVGQLWLGLLLVAYGFSAAAHLNVQLDTSTPSTFNVAVLESEEDDDKGKLTLAPWGPFGGPYSADVASWLQQEAPVGSRVKVTLHKGRFGARWWQIGPPETDSGQ